MFLRVTRRSESQTAVARHNSITRNISQKRPRKFATEARRKQMRKSRIWSVLRVPKRLLRSALSELLSRAHSINAPQLAHTNIQHTICICICSFCTSTHHFISRPRPESRTRRETEEAGVLYRDCSAGLDCNICTVSLHINRHHRHSDTSRVESRTQKPPRAPLVTFSTYAHADADILDGAFPSNNYSIMNSVLCTLYSTNSRCNVSVVLKVRKSLKARNNYKNIT